MRLSDALKKRSSRPDPAADPAYAFGARDWSDDGYPPADGPDDGVAPAERPGAGRRVSAFFSGLRDRISGGADPSFDDPDWYPEEDVPWAEAGREAAFVPPETYDPGPDEVFPAGPEPETPYAETPPDYDYNYYARTPAAPPPRESAPARPEPYAAEPIPAYPEDDFSSFTPEESPRYDAPAPDAPDGGEWYGPERMPRQSRAPRSRMKTGDLTYYFWSGAIVISLLLTAVAFVYGCVA